MACLIFLGASAAPAAEVLFPEPLHLTRRIQDPITDTTTTVEEYCVGNRIITVRGSKVAIADYERQELVEIDHAAATHSIVKFAELAKTRQATRTLSRKEAASPTSLGLRAAADGRTLDLYEVRADSIAEKPTLEVGLDRSVTLSREALDVLLGAAYPNEPTWQHDAVARASQRPRLRVQSASTDATEAYGLPMTQSLTWDVDGKRMTIRNDVIAVDRNPPPPEVLVVPRGSRLIEAESVITKRLLDELEPRKLKD